MPGEVGQVLGADPAEVEWWMLGKTEENPVKGIEAG